MSALKVFLVKKIVMNSISEYIIFGEHTPRYKFAYIQQEIWKPVAKISRAALAIHTKILTVHLFVTIESK